MKIADCRLPQSIFILQSSICNQKLTPMDENLVGYLLKALETDECLAVETYLDEHPEAQQRLEQLRRHSSC